MSEKNRKNRKQPAAAKTAETGTVFRKNTVLVIGGGASGLMAAITAAANGAKVTLLEQNDRNGKKLNATGNGKCNYTNTYWDEQVIRGTHPEFADHALQMFSYEDTISFFCDLGILPQNKNGYLYPKSGQASSITTALNLEAEFLGVKMKTREKVCRIEKITARDEAGNADPYWRVLTEGWHYEAESLILACGSNASSIAGADGSGYSLAESLGHGIIMPMPALTGLKLKGSSKLFSGWAGVRQEGTIHVYSHDTCIASASGELQLTDYGVSGIPVFQVSRYAIREQAEGKKVRISLDLLSDLTAEEAEELYQKRRQRFPKRKEQELYLGWLPDKLSGALLNEAFSIAAIKDLSFELKEGMPMTSAQAASGGVSTEEIDPKTMESLLHRNLYFCGELIDIDGTCGGYNLQWAWSSGFCAGIHAAGKEYS